MNSPHALETYVIKTNQKLDFDHLRPLIASVLLFFWERKQQCHVKDKVKDTVKVKIKIKIVQTEKKLSKKRRGMKCLICNQKKEDATGHEATKLECQTAETGTFIKYKIQNTSNQWAEVASKAQLYRENKELRK